ncbi:MAG: transglutaminase family protein [bacterium]
MRNHFLCLSAGRLAILLGLLLAVFSISCDKRDAYGVPVGDTGLQSGINYMQPNKWEFSYRFKVDGIDSIKLLRDRNPSIFNPKSKVTGPGTFEIWFTGPIESDEVRKVELISVTPEPTRIEFSEEDGKTWLYFDAAPDNRLPYQFEIEATWSFYTFERYVYWKDLDVSRPYDKESELYKKYTREEYPLVFHAGLVKDASECVDPGDPDNHFTTSLNIYNKIMSEYMYDYKHMFMIGLGEAGLIPTDRVWLNKRGICDEFANIFVAMARSQGIPARPCCGFAHMPIDDATRGLSDEEIEQLKDMKMNVNRTIGMPGGHAWAEFYLEGVGWIPLDATWGSNEMVIPSDLSPMGNRRNIPIADYYFGKMDPYRITLFKSWNYELMPAPRTPDADPIVPWMTMPSVRYSGVKDMIHGYDPTRDHPELARIAHLMPKETQSQLVWDMKNSRHRVVHIANPPQEEVKELIAQIESEGNHFVEVPMYKWDADRVETTLFSW